MNDSIASLNKGLRIERTLQWRHNERDGVSNHRHLECLLNRLCRRRFKKTSKLRVTGLGEENPPVTSGFPSHKASNAENVSIWWRHYVLLSILRGAEGDCDRYCFLNHRGLCYSVPSHGLIHCWLSVNWTPTKKFSDILIKIQIQIKNWLIINVFPQFEQMNDADKFVFMLSYPDQNLLTIVGKFIYICFQLRNSCQ